MADTASLIVRVNAEGVDKASKQLDSFATAAETAERASNKLPNATKTAEASIKKLGHVAGQAGFQLSDFVVQVQGGTSAFTAFAQQGGQLFGAISPIAGLVATVAGVVGGALYNSLSDSTASSHELADAQERVKDMLELTEKGVYEVSDAFITYVRSGATASEISATLYTTLGALRTQFKAATADIIENGKALQDNGFLTSLAVTQMAAAGQAAQGIKLQMNASAESLGLTTDEWKNLNAAQDTFNKAPTVKNAEKLSAVSGALFDKYGEGNKKLADYNATLQDTTYKLRENAKQNEVVKKSREEANKKIAEQDKAEADLEAKLRKREADRLAREAEQAKNKADRQAKAYAAEAQRQQKAADTFLATLARQNSDELAAVKAQEEQKLATLNEFYAKGNIDQQAYEEAKTQIVTDAEAKRNEIITKQRDELMKKQMSADAYVAQMQALGESEFAELDRQYSIKLKKLDDFHAQGLVSEQDYQASLNAMNSEYALDRAKATSNAFGSMASNIGSALGEASGAYKAFAIVQATIATYTAAIEAYKSTAAIPVVGPFLAPVAAAAAVGAGMAQVSAIRSAREQGGQLAAGQASTIAERGKPEVIMPAGASRVRTVQQMREMMGQDNKSGGGDNVTIVNNTTGRVDSAVTERDDEGRLRIIISETVASQLQDNNSPISKARRSTRGRPGY